MHKYLLTAQMRDCGGGNCNGPEHDDSAAINAAIIATSVMGTSTVILPATVNGCYGNVSISQNNVALKGSTYGINTPGGAKLTQLSPFSPALSIGAVGGVSIEKLVVRGFTATASLLTSTTEPTIKVTGTTNSLAHNITFRDISVVNGYDAVYLADAGQVRWYGGQIRNFTHSGIRLTGGSVSGGLDDYFYGLVIDQDDKSYQDQGNLSAGFLVEKSGGSLTIDGTDIIHSHSGIKLIPASGQFVLWVYLNSVFADTCDYTDTTSAGAMTVNTAGPAPKTRNTYVKGGAGLNIAPTGTGIVYGVVASNLWTSTCYRGVSVVGAGNTVSGLSISNLQALNNGAEAFFAVNASDVSLSNPLVSGAGQLAPAKTYPGISIGTGVDRVSITGGRVGPMQSYGPTQNYGIFFDTSFAGSALISAVALEGNAAGSVYLGPPTTTGIKISGSSGVNPRGALKLTPMTSPWTYTAGVSEETLHITGGSDVYVGDSLGAYCVASPCAVNLYPGQSVQITYLKVPSVVVSRQ